MSHPGIEDNSAIIEAFQSIGKRAYQRGLCSANEGNFSCRIGDQHILCTVTNVSKGTLSESDFTVIDFEGNNLYSDRKASSEVLLHVFIYQERPDVKVVLHLHSPFTLALSLLDPYFAYDVPLTAESILMWGRIPVVPFALPGTEDVPGKIAPYLKNCQAVVLAYHGIVAWGKDVSDTYHLIEALESYSFLYYQLHPYRDKLRTLSEEDVNRLRSLRNRYFPERRYPDDPGS